MSTTLPKTRVLGCALLFSAPVFCLAQSFPAQADSSPSHIDNDKTASFLTDAAPFPSSNAASASLERALARAVTVKFAPLGFVAGVESASGQEAFSPDAFFPGEMLLAQVDFPQIAQAQGSPPTQAPKTNPPEPNLGDLGFPTAQTQGSAQDQARLDKRSHMLKIHQRLGLITTVPLAATLLTSGLAGGRSTSSTGRDLHAALGTITAGMYITTAYYSIFAPKIAGTPARGPIRLHKALAFIHGPGMILTPILGAMAFNQKNAGEKVHGIASAHGAVAAITGIAYGLAIVSVSVHF
jgi:hypothetical protein